MAFVAMTHPCGEPPQGLEGLPRFETCEAAWTYLADNLPEAEAWWPEDEDDPEGPHRRSDLALRLEAHARLAEQVTVVGTVNNGDCCWTVERDEDEED